MRYPVEDFAGYVAALEALGVEPAFRAESVPIGGMGEVTLFTVRDPDGNLTEFYNAG